MTRRTGNSMSPGQRALARRASPAWSSERLRYRGFRVNRKGPWLMSAEALRSGRTVVRAPWKVRNAQRAKAAEPKAKRPPSHRGSGFPGAAKARGKARWSRNPTPRPARNTTGGGRRTPGPVWSAPMSGHSEANACLHVHSRHTVPGLGPEGLDLLPSYGSRALRSELPEQVGQGRSRAGEAGPVGFR